MIMSMILKRYKKKTEIIDAYQFFPEDGIVYLGIIAINYFQDGKQVAAWIIQTKEGEYVQVYPGDWIIRDINGQFSKIEQTEFDKLYDEIIPENISELELSVKQLLQNRKRVVKT